MAGNAVAGALSDRFGRRRVLLGTALLFVVSPLLASLATTFTGFRRRAHRRRARGRRRHSHRARVHRGDRARQRRGRLVSLNQLMIVIGISASFFSNYCLLGVGEHNWRWMLGVQVIPASLYFVLLLFVPESPRWLLLKGRDAAGAAGSDEGERRSAGAGESAADPRRVSA